MGAATFPAAAAAAAALQPDAELEPWDGYAGYLERLEDQRPSVNAAALIGHGTVRAAVLRGRTDPPTDGQLDHMAALVAEGMGAGCLGLSTGLVY